MKGESPHGRLHRPGGCPLMTNLLEMATALPELAVVLCPELPLPGWHSKGGHSYSLLLPRPSPKQEVHLVSGCTSSQGMHVHVPCTQYTSPLSKLAINFCHSHHLWLFVMVCMLLAANIHEAGSRAI